MSVRSKPNREGEAPAEPERDGSCCPNTMTMRRAVFVPSGTPDNSPPFQRWDTRHHNTTSPGRDERARERDTTRMMDQRTMRAECLSPLRGFVVGWPLRPTDESVGYCRVSLRDKRQTGVAP